MRAWKTSAASPPRQEALESPRPLWHIVPMHADEIKLLLHHSPFRPFTLFMPSEKNFHVPHEDFAWLMPNGRTLIVATAEGTAAHHLSVPMITRVEVQEASQPN